MKKISFTLFIALLLSGVLVIQGCHSGEETGNNDGTGETAVSGESSGITISEDQFAQASMKIGNPEEMVFKHYVKSNGYIQVSPDGKAVISSFTEGKVNDIRVSLGDKVSRGQVLFTLEGNGIIQLQQEYAEAYGTFMRVLSEYERQKVLASENITAKKELVNAESEYMIYRSRVESLKARLALLNIDTDAIEKGNIIQSIRVTSPIEGYISSLDIMLGKDVQPQEELVEIINPEKLQLELYVFKKDIPELKKGQEIVFTDPDQVTISYDATLRSVGRSVDNESKTVPCIATLDKANRQFVNRTFVEAAIITKEREVFALPAEAVFAEDDRYFALQLTGKDEAGYHLVKIPVQVGVIQEEMIEVLDGGLKDILVAGVYNLTGE